MTYTLDETLGLERRGDDVFAGRTDGRYWNLIGPYGGWIAALTLKAVLHDLDDPRFEPTALTVDFMKAPGEGEIVVERRLDRGGRTAAFWRAEARMPDGSPCARAQAILARRRDTLEFSRNGTVPDAPPPETFEPFESAMLPVRWARLYDMRVVKGHPGAVTPDARSLAWVREADGRPLDHLSLAAIADSPFPRLFLATGKASNVSTISMTTYFHAPAAELRTVGNAFILASARCERAGGGFYDQHAGFRSAAGALLAVSQQLVWYDRKP